MKEIEDHNKLSGVLADFKRSSPIVQITLSVLLAGLLFTVFYHRSAMTRFEKTQSQMALDTAVLEQKIGELEKTLAETREENEDLDAKLRSEKRRNQKFEDQIEDIAGTVSVLDKLRKTDSELLRKYSKISFLNENYLPEGLKDIDDEFLANTATNQKIHSRVESFLQDMLEDAKKDEKEFDVVSAYRSFGNQGALKSRYTVIYGSGANQFSADQGYSEHQLGTAVDFSTPSLNGILDGFDTTEAYQWLLKNAHKYGFVLSYPAGNTYYQFEPWHWRFVGVDLATDLHRDNKYFYDLEQREIDAYLIKLFD